MAKSKWWMVKDRLKDVEKWAADGLTEAQICKNLGISVNTMNDYKKLEIWKESIILVVDVYNLTKKFPKSEMFGLTSQIKRCSVSIPSNIAEGSSRRSEKDYNRFLEISLGSSFELETQLLIGNAVNFGDNEIRNNILKDIDEEQKMLMSFMNKLNN